MSSSSVKEYKICVLSGDKNTSWNPYEVELTTCCGHLSDTVETQIPV